MSVVESASATLGKKAGPLPVGGWAAIGIGVIVVVKFLGRGKSSSGVVTIPDAFPADGSTGSGSGTTTPTTTPPVGTLPGAPGKLRITITGPTDLLSTLGRLIGHATSGTYDATIYTMGGKKYYRFLRSIGGVKQWTLIPVGTKTVTEHRG